jgi:acyl-CoA thioesterase-1
MASSTPLTNKLVAGGKILCIGDSTTMGYGGENTDYKLNTWSAKFASGFATKYGVNVSTENFLGCLFGYTYPNFDSRLSVPSSWTAEGGGYFGYFSVGGGVFASSNTTDSIVFTPRTAVQNVDVYATKRGGSLQVTLTDASSNAQLLTQQLTIATSTDMTDVMSKFSLRLSSPANCKIAIKAVQSPAFLIGVSAYLDNAVQVLNAGVGGATTQTFNDDSARTRIKYCFEVLQPDLTICCLGINDYWHALNDQIPGMNVAFFVANYTQFLTDIKRNWNHTIITYTPNPTNAMSQTIQRSYCAATISLSQTLQNYCFDLNAVMTDYTSATNAGYVSTNDQVHPTIAGYTFIGNQVLNYFANLKI